MPALRLPAAALATALTTVLVASLGLSPGALARPAPVQSGARGHHEPVETRTFRISVALNGTYHQNVAFSDLDAQGFCPGTGQALTAAFTVTGTATLRVKLDTNRSSHAKLDVNDFASNAWEMDLATVAQGDPCSAIVNDHCSGSTGLGTGDASKNFAYAQGAGHKIVFGTELTGTVVLSPKNTDCHYADGSGYYPVGDFLGLPYALQPYVSASIAVPLVRLNDLKKGQSISKSYKPLKGSIPSGYDIATCDHTEGNVCSASIDHFVHTLTIKRIS